MSEGRRFDLAVVDGNHRFDAVFVDVYYLARLLRLGGIVSVHDHHLPGIAQAAAPDPPARQPRCPGRVPTS
jgi:cephalosporin hydroxylase